jgi:hypothetical protein
MNTQSKPMPELLVDDHHGQYMGQICYQTLREDIRAKLDAKLPVWAQTALNEGPDNEEYLDACDLLEDFSFTEGDTVFYICYEDGGIFAVPEGYDFYEDAE